VQYKYKQTEVPTDCAQIILEKPSGPWDRRPVLISKHLICSIFLTSQKINILFVQLKKSNCCSLDKFFSSLGWSLSRANLEQQKCEKLLMPWSKQSNKIVEKAEAAVNWVESKSKRTDDTKVRNESVHCNLKPRGLMSEIRPRTRCNFSGRAVFTQTKKKWRKISSTDTNTHSFLYGSLHFPILRPRRYVLATSLVVKTSIEALFQPSHSIQ
jgi:hypothetical protein